MDTSAAMGAPSGVGGLTLEQALAQTANLGLTLFPDSAQIRLWEMADKVSGNLPYKQLVPVGPLPDKLGLISRRVSSSCRSTRPCSRWPTHRSR